MACDPALDAAVERHTTAGRPAPEAIVRACDEHAAAIAAIGDERLAARAEDVRSLGRRAARLAGAADELSGPVGDDAVVLVADDLGPADVAELDGAVVAIALAARRADRARRRRGARPRHPARPRARARSDAGSRRDRGRRRRRHGGARAVRRDARSRARGAAPPARRAAAGAGRARPARGHPRRPARARAGQRRDRRRGRGGPGGRRRGRRPHAHRAGLPRCRGAGPTRRRTGGC